MSNKKKRSYTVGVLLGGTSSERAVSLRSGTAIAEALRAQGMQVITIDTKKDVKKQLAAHPIDVAFLALHGRGGEDGTIQRVLESVRIPYTGSDAQASLRAFDKVKTKQILQKHGIPVPRFAVVTQKNWRSKVKQFSFPVVIKPIDDGSSIGVYLVQTIDALEKRFQSIFKKTKRYLMEERIVGREITVGILGKRALPLIELKPHSAFYDYHSKYTAGETEYLIPASFPQKDYKRYQRIAVATHNALGARDLSRIDIMIDQEGNPYVLELNSIPGFTGTSLLPKAAKYSGLEFGDLCRTIMEYALRRARHGTKKNK